MSIKQNIDFQVNFDGQIHQIDVDMLINSLISVSEIIHEVNENLSPESKIDIKIEAPEKGSFTLLLTILAEKLPDLFSSESMNYAANILDILVGLFVLKSLIKKNGRPTQIKNIKGDNKEDLVELKFKKGNVHIDKSITLNLYNSNQKIQDNTAKVYKNLESDPAITDFTINNNKGKELFKENSSNFPALSKAEIVEGQKTNIEIKRNATLNVFKIIFEDKYKWEFYYQGMKISTLIKDKRFFKKIDKGEIGFKKGDKLIVDLEIIQIFDEGVNAFVNKDCTILKVHKHIPRKSSIQPKFDIKGM